MTYLTTITCALSVLPIRPNMPYFFVIVSTLWVGVYWVFYDTYHKLQFLAMRDNHWRFEGKMMVMMMMPLQHCMF